MTWKTAAQVFLHSFGITVLINFVQTDRMPLLVALLLGLWVLVSGFVAFLQGFEEGAR